MSSGLRTTHRALAVALLVAAGAGILAARSALGIEWNVGSVRGLVDRLGVWAPIGFVLLVAFRTPLLLPSQLVLTVGGLCFGALQGTLWGALGILLSGVFAFGVARWLGAEALRARVPAGLARTLRLGGTRGGAAFLAVATGYPVGPIALLHAAAALTGMGFASFLVAAATGSTLRAALYAYFGSSLLEGRWGHVGLAAVILGVCLLPLLHPGVRAWVRRQLEAAEPGPRGQPTQLAVTHRRPGDPRHPGSGS
jgi:uncharacterized membrane protein YdjX (TVP38/TMEM64 family)